MQAIIDNHLETLSIALLMEHKKKLVPSWTTNITENRIEIKFKMELPGKRKRVPRMKKV